MQTLRDKEINKEDKKMGEIIKGMLCWTDQIQYEMEPCVPKPLKELRKVLKKKNAPRMHRKPQNDDGCEGPFIAFSVSG